MVCGDTQRHWVTANAMVPRYSSCGARVMTNVMPSSVLALACPSHRPQLFEPSEFFDDLPMSVIVRINLGWISCKKSFAFALPIDLRQVMLHIPT